MEKKKIFLISDYRNVTCEPTRDQSYWILKELDRADRFKVYGTANRVINSNCFKNIDFLTLDYRGKIGDRFVGQWRAYIHHNRSRLSAFWQHKNDRSNKGCKKCKK